MKNEDAFLKLIDTFFPTEHDFINLGRGDDCAILTGGKDYCVSSDLFLEDIHFRREYFSAADIGYKALAVNLSDIAAMGAKPVAFTMDLMAPAGIDDTFWESFFKSMAMLARQNDIVLAGGDLSLAEKIGVSITIFGVSGSTGFIRRTNCSSGDVLFSIGDLGLAKAGLAYLETTGIKAKETFPAAVQAHLRPKPKVMVGTLLNAAGINSLMDVSDGLARDIPRLIGPELGADLVLKETLLHADVIACAKQNGVAPMEFAVLGGEDYALLGTVPPLQAGKAESVPGFTRIGTVANTPGIRINGKPFQVEGFDHFSQ